MAAEGLGYQGAELAAEQLTPDGVATLVRQLVGPLRERFGSQVSEGFHRGFHDARWLVEGNQDHRVGRSRRPRRADRRRDGEERAEC